MHRLSYQKIKKKKKVLAGSFLMVQQLRIQPCHFVLSLARDLAKMKISLQLKKHELGYHDYGRICFDLSFIWSFHIFNMFNNHSIKQSFWLQIAAKKKNEKKQSQKKSRTSWQQNQECNQSFIFSLHLISWSILLFLLWNSQQSAIKICLQRLRK